MAIAIAGTVTQTSNTTCAKLSGQTTHVWTDTASGKHSVSHHTEWRPIVQPPWQEVLGSRPFRSGGAWVMLSGICAPSRVWLEASSSAPGRAGPCQWAGRGPNHHESASDGGPSMLRRGSRWVPSAPIRADPRPAVNLRRSFRLRLRNPGPHHVRLRVGVGRWTSRSEPPRPFSSSNVSLRLGRSGLCAAGQVLPVALAVTCS